MPRMRNGGEPKDKDGNDTPLTNRGHLDESLFQAFFHLSLDLLVVCDLNGYFLHIGGPWESTLGWTEQELMAQPFISFVHPDDRDLTRHAWERLLAGDDLPFFENRYRTRRGDYRWLQWTSRPYPDRNVVLAVAREVTDRKLAEAELEKARDLLERRVDERTADLARSEERLLQIVTNIREAFWMIKADLSEVLYVSPAAEEIFGRSLDFLRSSPTAWLESVHPDDRAVAAAGLQAVTSGEERDSTGRIVRPDGAIRWVRTRAFPIRDESGKVVSVCGVGEDVTESVEAETRYRSIFDGSPDGIVVADADTGRVLFANPAFCELFGYGIEDIEGLSVPDFHPKEILNHAVAEFEAHARGEKTVTLALPCIRRDESVFPADVTTRPTVLVGRHVNVGFFRNVSERVAMEKAEAETAVAREASRMKSEFLASMSHELRTPLNTIIGFSDLLVRGETDPGSPKHRQFLEFILSAADHLLSLVNDVLDLSKIEAGKLELFPESIDMEALTKGTMDTLKELIGRKMQKVDVAIDATVRHVHNDPVRLKQVIYNYTSNAVKFTPERGKISVRVDPIDDRLFRIEVKDNGIGIDAKDRERLFTDFGQLDQPMEVREQGTGLGLALVKRIAEAEGGSVGVDSEPGRGSTFWVDLPHDLPVVHNSVH